ncbi:MAG: hypothetical protein EWM50_07560 [Gottschalkiaceae bacterium]|nr:MAG: hypothetical protein EWM50_07560 [Gottschalkiaceae bacterium]
MEFIKNDEKIAHLSDEQIEELIRRYYSNENAGSLVEEYDINISPSRLYTIFPPEICYEQICPNCNIPMVKDRKSKSSYSYRRNNKNDFYCYLCGHITNLQRCRCSNCIIRRENEAERRAEEKRLEELRKRQLISETYSLGKSIKIEFDSISFRDRVYLGSLLRACLSEDLTTIYSVESCDRSLAPLEDMRRELVLSLSNKNIIVVSPDSPIEAFTESEDIEFPNVYYIYKVNYHLNIEFLGDKQEFISKIINPVEFDKEYSDEAYIMWKDIALAECLEYFNYQMKSVNFNFNPGDKTLAVFNDLLSKYSVSQIYGIIYKSIAQATKFYQEGNVGKKQAANSVIGNCQRFGERAEINGWDLTKYRRTKECPQTMISEFFFNRVLRIGDNGFNMPPMKL